VSESVATLLVAEMEEYFEHFDHFPLYHLTWVLRGQGPAMTPDEMRAAAQIAYDDFRSRHKIRVVWTRWPIDLETAWPVEDGTPLDFDLDPDQDVSIPLQVLVPDEAVRPEARSAPSS